MGRLYAFAQLIESLRLASLASFKMTTPQCRCSHIKHHGGCLPKKGRWFLIQKLCDEDRTNYLTRYNINHGSPLIYRKHYNRMWRNNANAGERTESVPFVCKWASYFLIPSLINRIHNELGKRRSGLIFLPLSALNSSGLGGIINPFHTATLASANEAFLSRA